MNWIEEGNDAQLDGTRDGEQSLVHNNPSQLTQQTVIHTPLEPLDATTHYDAARVHGKGKEPIDAATHYDHAATQDDSTIQPKRRKNSQKWMEQAYVDGQRIYVNNCRRSEAIKN